MPWLTALGFSLAPLVDGLFMVILKDPERARSMGLISAKAQITAGSADWPTFLNVLAQAMAIAGLMIFSIITAWVFGREFSDRTVKNLLAIPTPREAIVAAKFVLIAIWAAILTLLAAGIGLAVGALVGLPGGSSEVLKEGMAVLFTTAALTLALMAPVALFASAGRGYLLPIGWSFLTVALAQIAAATGWGDWFAWSVPALFSGMAGPRSDLLGVHSYLIVFLTIVAGLVGTLAWWRYADQTR